MQPSCKPAARSNGWLAPSPGSCPHARAVVVVVTRLPISLAALLIHPCPSLRLRTQGEWEEYKGRRGTPKFLILIVVVAVVSLLCVVCNRVSTVLSDVRGGESPMHGDEDDESPDVSSPDVSPHGSPIMSRAMQIMAGKTPKADRGTAERDPDSAAAGATAGSALLDLQPPKLVLSGSSPAAPAAPAAAAAAAAVTSSSKAAASGIPSGSVVTFSSSSTSSDKRSQELL
jgi:hypothetical protein